MIYVLWMVGLLRRGMNRVVDTDSPSITAVLSNPGRVFARSPLLDPHGRLRADTIVVEEIELDPPVRQGVGAAVGALTYADQLSLALNYDRNKFSATSAQELLGQYVATIQNDAKLLSRAR